MDPAILPTGPWTAEFRYLSAIAHGVAILAQTMTVGSIVCLVMLAARAASPLEPAGRDVTARAVRMASGGAAILVVADLLAVAFASAGWAGSNDWLMSALIGVRGAAAVIQAVVVLAIVVLLRRRAAQAPALPLLGLSLLLPGAGVFTHAIGRLWDLGMLIVPDALHQAGAALWIGTLPLAQWALRSCRAGPAPAMVLGRQATLSALGVVIVGIGGVILAILLVGAPRNLAGSPTGMTVLAKIVIASLMLCLRGMGLRAIHRAGGVVRGPTRAWMCVTAELELALGIVVIFATSALMLDLPAPMPDGLGWPDLLARTAPDWYEAWRRSEGFTATQAWSNATHRAAGVLLAVSGLVALLHRSGARWASAWPWGFVGLGMLLPGRAAVFPWPAANPEQAGTALAFQATILAGLAGCIGWCEWRAERPGSSARYRLVFAAGCIACGTLLLMHTPALPSGSVQDLVQAVFRKQAYDTLAMIGIVTGCARWLELRLDPAWHTTARRIAGWVWPLGLVLAGAILLAYRDA